ncbi:hypothetical protein ACFQ7J_21785 [Streptomyces sp. NPDC056501]|uniref:hypothetical protein n=1 Tax=Streptomyces sp. NPDC056501 TaxID=3345841 RepID=UPI003695887F
MNPREEPSSFSPMNLWNEHCRALLDVGQDGDDLQADWERLERAETAGIAAVCIANLCKGDLVLAEVPMGQAGRPAQTRQSLEGFAQRLSISVDTADQYRRVAAWYTQERREAIAKTGGVASYTLLRDVALHTFGAADDPDTRFDVLLTALQATASTASARLSRQEYLRLLGVGHASTDVAAPTTDGMAATADSHAALVEQASIEPAFVAAVLRSVANEPEGLTRFFDGLAAEGGMEALNSAASALRKVKAEAKAQDVHVFGTDEPPGPIEVILRTVLRAMKALEKPLDLDPAEVVEALPPEQFRALSRLCGSITEWHELLLTTARSGTHEKKEVA